MAVVVKGKNIEVTPALRECVETSATKLHRFFADDMEIDVRAVLSVKKENQKAEITCYVEGLILRGEDNSRDMYTSIDDAFEKIIRQIHKYKTRLAKRFKKPNAFKAMAAQEAAVQEDTMELVRRKQIPLKPMTEEEAILQMNLLNHDFFMFINAQNDQPTVVYRRKNGAYGLIEP